MGSACFVFLLFLKIMVLVFLRQKMEKIYYLNNSRWGIALQLRELGELWDLEHVIWSSLENCTSIAMLD